MTEASPVSTGKDDVSIFFILDGGQACSSSQGCSSTVDVPRLRSDKGQRSGLLANDYQKDCIAAEPVYFLHGSFF